MSKMTIEKVYPKSTLYPMLLTFQNGDVTKELEDKTCSYFENRLTGVKAVATEVDNVVYAGEEQESSVKTMVLARNRINGKVRLVEVGRADLTPVFVETNEMSTTEFSFLDLSRKFGSKRYKKTVEHNEKLKLNVEMVNEQMKDVTQNISEEKLDVSLFNKIDADDFYIPPVNRDATAIENVYNMNALLTEEEYDNIYSEIDGKSYIEEMDSWLKDIASKKTLTKKQTVLGLYANCLIKLYKANIKDITKKSFLVCQSSFTLNRIVMSNFMEEQNGKRTRPLPYRDRTICYLIVIVLLINNYKFELNKLCDALSLTPSKAMIKVKVTGATIATTGDKKIVVLKLPLMKFISKKRKSMF